MTFEFDLPIENVDFGSLRETLKQTSILIVTVNVKERESLLKYLLPVPERGTILSTVHDGSTYRIGRLGNHLVAHVQSGMGSVSQGASTLTVFKALGHIEPKLVIMVGVAFGMKQDKQSLGDILVSKRIINYEIARLNSSDFDITPRGASPDSGPLLFNILTNVIDWNHHVTRKRKARILPGELLSGEKLVDNKPFREKLEKLFPNAIGGEMEASGLSSACAEKNFTQWIIVKGICDWADGKKNSAFQPKAALASMSLVFHVLSTPSVFSDLGIHQYSTKVIKAENNRYTLNAQRGTPLWTLNRIRSSVLTMLIKDLKAYEQTGYSEEICNAVRKDLEGLYDEIKRLPKFYSGSTELRKVFGEFIQAYLGWNSIKGGAADAITARNVQREEMKRLRSEVSRIIRLSQKSLSYNMTEISTVQMFDFQKELVRKFSDVFPNLGKAVRRISKRLTHTPPPHDLEKLASPSN